MFSRIIPIVLAATFSSVFANQASAQAEWIYRLDDNDNGFIEPDEISSRARPYFERFARENGINLSRPNSIRRLEYAARRYFERRGDNDSDNIEPEVKGNIRGFGIQPDATLVPGFGVSKLKYPYTLEDVEQAESTLDRYDRDDDGFLNRREADRARWTDTNPFDDDSNGDGLLSRMELVQRYARKRTQENRESNSFTFRSYDASMDRREIEEDERRNRERQFWRNRGRDRGSRELAYSVIERYDFNKNNQLEPTELAAAGFDAGKADFNRDGKVSRDELSRWLSEEMDVIGNRLSEELPTWFFERDLNGDKQIQMSEFTDEWDAGKTEEFASYDLNRDGILTVDELLNSRSIVGGKFANQNAKILLPRDSVLSEIVVEEDYVIGDLQLQLSITHTYTEHLDAYLVGPDGKQVELFTGVGGSDDHFDRTVFSDDARENIARSRPPFRGTYQPEAILKRQPGLNQYKGKNLKGIWQLIVRSSRSERSGILHNWSLIVKPAAKDEYPAEAAAEE